MEFLNETTIGYRWAEPTERTEIEESALEIELQSAGADVSKTKWPDMTSIVWQVETDAICIHPAHSWGMPWNWGLLSEYQKGNYVVRLMEFLSRHLMVKSPFGSLKSQLLLMKIHILYLKSKRDCFLDSLWCMLAPSCCSNHVKILHFSRKQQKQQLIFDGFPGRLPQLSSFSGWNLSSLSWPRHPLPLHLGSIFGARWWTSLGERSGFLCTSGERTKGSLRFHQLFLIRIVGTSATSGEILLYTGIDSILIHKKKSKFPQIMINMLINQLLKHFPSSGGSSRLELNTGPQILAPVLHSQPMPHSYYTLILWSQRCSVPVFNHTSGGCFILKMADIENSGYGLVDPIVNQPFWFDTKIRTN